MRDKEIHHACYFHLADCQQQCHGIRQASRQCLVDAASQHEAPAKQTWQSTLDTNDLLKQPKPLSLGVDITTDSNGNRQITPYQKLNLTAEKSVSLSFEKQKPRIKFNAGGINTSLKLRGDGVKMQFNPSDKTIPLQIELKITDDESMMRLDYRF